MVMDEMMSVAWDEGVPSADEDCGCCESTAAKRCCCCCWSGNVLDSSACDEPIEDGVADEAAVVDWVELSEVPSAPALPTFDRDVVAMGRIDMLGVTPLWMGVTEAELLVPSVVEDCCGWSEWSCSWCWMCGC